MKKKQLFATVAMATVLAACSQEELAVVNNNVQNLGDRPMVEAPVISLGSLDSRMTTTGLYAGVEWAPGDGFGAAVMDTYNAEGKTFDEKFKVVDYINSNVLFQTEDGSNFYADASMPEGNHLFYAPFNKENISRAPLATQLPLLQVVDKSSYSKEAPSNDIIKAFYEDGKYPVFVAYDQVYGTPKTTLELQMRHIYSLPMVTLKFGDKVQLLDEDGIANTVEVEDENGKKVNVPVYEQSITINSIVFQKGQIATKGAIKNSQIQKLLAKTEDGELVWDSQKYEDAKTADLLMAETESEEVVVEFKEGLELNADKTGYFFMVLPGAEYAKDNLKVYVNATINGESYRSAVVSTKATRSIEPAREARLLPGQAYSADEYTAEGKKKNSAGNSMTYVIDGTFAPTAVVEAPEITGYVEIETKEDLIEYINKVAYRGVAVSEISEEAAKQQYVAGTYVAGINFVITATEEAPIALDKDVVDAFKNSCVITGKEASISFLGNAKNLVLGDMTWTEEESELISFSEKVVYAKGAVVMQDAPAKIKTLSGAVVTLESEAPVTVENDWNAVVNIDSKAAHNVTSIYGTVNVNVTTAANITNKYTEINEEIISSTLKIADDVITSGKIINDTYGIAEIGKAVVTMTNDGEVTLTSNKSKLTVDGTGTVDNTEHGKVTNNGNNRVYAEMGDMTDGALIDSYDDLTGLNEIVLKGTWTITGDLDMATVANTTIKTIQVEENGVIDMDAATLDLNGATVYINAETTWIGRDYSKSIISDATIVDPENKLTLIDINIQGYKSVANAKNLNELVTAGGEVVLNTNFTAEAGSSLLEINSAKDVTIDMNNQEIVHNTTKGADKLFTVDDTKVTFTGEGTIEGVRMVHAINGSEVTIDGGHWIGTDVTTYGLFSAAQDSKVIIENGIFEVSYDTSESKYQNKLLGKDFIGRVIVKGGTFKNFNPKDFLDAEAKVKVFQNGNDVTAAYAEVSYDYTSGIDLTYVVE